MSDIRQTAVLAAMAVIAVATPASAAEFSYHEVFDRWAKANEFFDADGAVGDWLLCFRPSVSQRTAGDEFAAAEIHKDSVAALKKEIAGTDPMVPLAIHTKVQFGEYDFTAHRFALRPLQDGMSFEVASGQANCWARAFPSTLRVVIGHPGILDGLPMPEDQAKAFLAGRRANAGGYTDREVEIILQVRADRLAGDDALAGTVTRYEVIDTGQQKLGVPAHSP
jgi:hypothetical protein